MRDNLDELRHIEGFPIGEDEHLHALSDPPHYTAYPNPHIAEFIEKWGKPYDEATDDYHREPYTGDVAEKKNDRFYTVHSYHTKVPDRIIQEYIKHYTSPDDIVIDVFAGSGMTGVATQALGLRSVILDLCPIATHIARNYMVLAHAVPEGVGSTFHQIMETRLFGISQGHGVGVPNLLGVWRGTPNKLGTPACYSCQLPKTRKP